MTTPLLDRTGLDRAAELAGLDTVVALDPGVRGEATRNVPSTSAIFATHFPRFPVLPGVLILDDLARLAALVLAGTGGPERWTLAAATRVRYRRYVRPGDVAALSVEVLPAAGEATLKATVRVDGALVTSVGALTLRDTTAGGTA